MNEWQLLMQMRYLLRNALWPGGASAIWGKRGVVISSTDVERLLPVLQPPFAVVRPGAGSHDPEYEEQPAILRYEPSVVLCAKAPDPYGQAALMGASIADETKSAGHGLFQYQEQLFSIMKELSKQSGITMTLQAVSSVASAPIETLGYVALREYAFRAYCGITMLYPGALNYLVTPNGGGQVQHNWDLPADRFDRVKVRITRKAGASAPANPGDGTDIGVTPLGTSKTEFGVAPGTYSYGLFAAYDDRGDPPAAELHYSAAFVRLAVVVT
jgi:hypothetical protein